MASKTAKKAAKKPAAKKAPAKRAAKATGEKNKGGRPSKFNQAVLDAICARLSRGEPLTQICASDDSYPADRTVRDWIEAMPEVSAAIAHAREVGFDVIAHGMRQVARGLSGSTGDVPRDRLIVETDFKLLAKWDPKRYGDMVKLSNPDGETPIAPPTPYSDMEPEERKALLRKLAADLGPEHKALLAAALNPKGT